MTVGEETEICFKYMIGFYSIFTLRYRLTKIQGKGRIKNGNHCLSSHSIARQGKGGLGLLGQQSTVA